MPAASGAGHPGRLASSKAPTVLISSAGRRVELLRAFRRAVGIVSDSGTLDAGATAPAEARPAGRVLATDCSWRSSAFHDADEGFLVPRCTDAAFLPAMLELCVAQQVDLIVPTIDTELAIFAQARAQFAEVGTTVAVSAPEVVSIAADKVATHDWLLANALPTVGQAPLAAVTAEADAWAYPLVVKPRFGSASDGVAVVDGPEALRHLAEVTPAHREMLVQSLARGEEHTVDVLVTSDSAPGVAAAVPRRRLEVRSGEVAKAVTVRSPELSELAGKLIAALPGAYGPLNIQVFVDDSTGQLAIIELNARFGGGFPLSLHAGSDMPTALLQDSLGLATTVNLTDWQDNLIMLRYDAAVFVDGATEPPTGT